MSGIFIFQRKKMLKNFGIFSVYTNIVINHITFQNKKFVISTMLCIFYKHAIKCFRANFTFLGSECITFVMPWLRSQSRDKCHDNPEEGCTPSNPRIAARLTRERIPAHTCLVSSKKITNDTNDSRKAR